MDLEQYDIAFLVVGHGTTSEWISKRLPVNLGATSDASGQETEGEHEFFGRKKRPPDRRGGHQKRRRPKKRQFVDRTAMQSTPDKIRVDGVDVYCLSMAGEGVSDVEVGGLLGSVNEMSYANLNKALRNAVEAVKNLHLCPVSYRPPLSNVSADIYGDLHKSDAPTFALKRDALAERYSGQLGGMMDDSWRADAAQVKPRGYLNRRRLYKDASKSLAEFDYVRLQGGEKDLHVIWVYLHTAVMGLHSCPVLRSVIEVEHFARSVAKWNRDNFPDKRACVVAVSCCRSETIENLYEFCTSIRVTPFTRARDRGEDLNVYGSDVGTCLKGMVDASDLEWINDGYGHEGLDGRRDQEGVWMRHRAGLVGNDRLTVARRQRRELRDGFEKISYERLQEN